MKALPLLLLASGLSLSFAASARKEIEVPINIGVGPAYHMMFGPLGEETGLLLGGALDVYAVITPEVLQKNKSQIPQRFRRVVNLSRELHLRPIGMMLIPSYFILQPVGPVHAYGATWQFFSINWAIPLVKGLEGEFGIDLPSISYMQIAADSLEPRTTRLFGVGAAPEGKLTARISPRWAISMNYSHQIYLPLFTNEYEMRNSNPEALIQHGIGALLVHYRLPTMQPF